MKDNQMNEGKAVERRPATLRFDPAKGPAFAGGPGPSNGLRSFIRLPRPPPLAAVAPDRGIGYPRRRA